jgi:hypothetical protein
VTPRREAPWPRRRSTAPPGYLLIAPISAILDTITLLSVRQHVALVVTLVLGWVVWWWVSRRERDLALPSNRRVVRIGARIASRS